jgi:AcrR family transcriptional regulator
MSAVYDLLCETSARDLTMDGVAKRARVGKPTLYKWWPSKAALVMAMFNERLARSEDLPSAASGESIIRAKMRRLIAEFNGLFGKVMADLIAEGQSEPEILSELVERHMLPRRTATIADIEAAKARGEFVASADAELLVDAIFGPMYYRLLLRIGPLTEEYGEDLVTQVLAGVKATHAPNDAHGRAT